MFANSIVHGHAQRGAHIRCSALGRFISRSSKGSRLPFGWFKAKNRKIVVNDHRTEYHNPSNGTQQRDIVLKGHFFCRELLYGILQRLFVGIEEIQRSGVRTESWTSHTAHLRCCLYSIGLSPPNDSLMRLQLYQLI